MKSEVKVKIVCGYGKGRIVHVSPHGTVDKILSQNGVMYGSAVVVTVNGYVVDPKTVILSEFLHHWSYQRGKPLEIRLCLRWGF